MSQFFESFDGQYNWLRHACWMSMILPVTVAQGTETCLYFSHNQQRTSSLLHGSKSLTSFATWSLSFLHPWQWYNLCFSVPYCCTQPYLHTASCVTTPLITHCLARFCFSCVKWPCRCPSQILLLGRTPVRIGDLLLALDRAWHPWWLKTPDPLWPKHSLEIRKVSWFSLASQRRSPSSTYTRILIFVEKRRLLIASCMTTLNRSTDHFDRRKRAVIVITWCFTLLPCWSVLHQVHLDDAVVRTSFGSSTTFLHLARQFALVTTPHAAIRICCRRQFWRTSHDENLSLSVSPQRSRVRTPSPYPNFQKSNSPHCCNCCPHCLCTRTRSKSLLCYAAVATDGVPSLVR